MAPQVWSRPLRRTFRTYAGQPEESAPTSQLANSSDERIDVVREPSWNAWLPLGLARLDRLDDLVEVSLEPDPGAGVPGCEPLP